jgi:hypothetical protein
VQNQKTLKSEEYRQLFHLPPEEVRESKSYVFCWCTRGFSFGKKKLSDLA